MPDDVKVPADTPPAPPVSELTEVEMGALVKSIRRASAPQRYQLRLVMDALTTADRIETYYTHEGQI